MQYSAALTPAPVAMISMKTGAVILITMFFLSAFAHAADSAESSIMTGKEMIAQCGYKNAGKDQRSKFTVTLKDAGGNTKKSIYLRLWKDYSGKKQVLDKMVLFTEFPPDSKGGAFMRTAFVPESKKNADQWIYLPVLRKIRRVTIRDPGDRFLNSDLTYQDVSYRSIDADEHFYIGMEEVGGVTQYKVESVPHEGDGLYSRRLFWIEKGNGPEWAQCVVKRISYYDNKGVLLKEQFLDWQNVDGAWMWKKVVVKDVQETHESIFEMDDVEVNNGLSDRVFTKRALKLGVDGINR